MRTPSKEERMNVGWVLFDGGTNTLSSELRNNKNNNKKTSAKVSSDDADDNDNEVTVGHEYPEKQRQGWMATSYFSRRRLPTLLNVAIYVHLNRDENGCLPRRPRAGATAAGNRRRRHIAYGFDDNGVVGLYHNRSTVVRLVIVRYSGDDWRNEKCKSITNTKCLSIVFLHRIGTVMFRVWPNLGEIREIQFYNARLNDTKKEKLERRPSWFNFRGVRVWRRPTFATFRASVHAADRNDHFTTKSIIFRVSRKRRRDRKK